MWIHKNKLLWQSKNELHIYNKCEYKKKYYFDRQKMN